MEEEVRLREDFYHRFASSFPYWIRGSACEYVGAVERDHVQGIVSTPASGNVHLSSSFSGISKRMTHEQCVEGMFGSFHPRIETGAHTY